MCTHAETPRTEALDTVVYLIQLIKYIMVHMIFFIENKKKR